MLLGAIALDLFAVLFGGAIALAPVFAREILHAGPVGLGILRSAPAVGALAAGIILARRPLRTRAGPTLLVVVGIFGVCMVVFGLSGRCRSRSQRSRVTGFVDLISVNIRSTTVALVTPDELRGRVNAVEMVFISASNELGAFESAPPRRWSAPCRRSSPAASRRSCSRLVDAPLPRACRIGRLEELRPSLSLRR